MVAPPRAPTVEEGGTAPVVAATVLPPAVAPIDGDALAAKSISPTPPPPIGGKGAAEMLATDKVWPAGVGKPPPLRCGVAVFAVGPNKGLAPDGIVAAAPDSC